MSATESVTPSAPGQSGEKRDVNVPPVASSSSDVETLAAEQAPASAVEQVTLPRDPSRPDVGRGDMRIAMAIVVAITVLLIVGAAIGLAVAPNLSP